MLPDTKKEIYIYIYGGLPQFVSLKFFVVVVAIVFPFYQVYKKSMFSFSIHVGDMLFIHLCQYRFEQLHTLVAKHNGSARKVSSQ